MMKMYKGLPFLNLDPTLLLHAHTYTQGQKLTKTCRDNLVFHTAIPKRFYLEENQYFFGYKFGKLRKYEQNPHFHLL
jgi:hypothetical protein